MSMPHWLNDQHTRIRASVRRFAESQIAPLSQQLREEETVPYEIWRQACKLGFAGLPYSPSYGGGGGQWLSFVIVLEELSRVDCALANSLMANSTVASLLSNYGTHEQKERFLRPILDGRQIGAIALCEPNAGSDTANIATRARLDGDRWVIDGSKIFISNSGTEITGTAILTVVTGMRADGRKEISNIIFPNGTPGCTYGPKLRKIGRRASTTSELFFENCHVPANHLLGERGAGLQQMLAQISTARILIGALALGILRGSLHRSLVHVKARQAFERSINEFQALQFKLADMATHAHAARLMLYDAAALKDAGASFNQQASIAKLFATQGALEAAHQAHQILGGYGIMGLRSRVPLAMPKCWTSKAHPRSSA
ncbi:acyl-CoA dehydrogenase family protein [Bradyrhizobium sp. BWA-3-5]|uniref:acyl-CoA dehydrogenase family protein n=1 Tax=Bradyrhizobium sp. BWA-3-5 TaxID=3080013 RepID=UPI00293F09CF|nr:acyl-CoA dehydrogenase family protein [Bradyrhizobium sp. BWA-3-5]WOH64029.1 acyl-CoA dehydrogenase family protein [Bradyrhizobium sp. BWA-3-5]